MTTITVKTSTATGFTDSKNFTVSPGNPAKIPTLPNSKVELFIDGVKQTGSEAVNGKRIQLKKVGQDLVLSLDDEPLVDMVGFYDVQGVALDGAGWQFTAAEGLVIQDGSMVALTGTASSADGVPGWAVIGLLGVVGLAATSGGGGDGISAMDTALAKIEAYNNSDGTTASIPTVQDYINAGVTGVDADNLSAVNAQVLKQNPGGANTAEKLQVLAAAANAALAKIEAYNNGDGLVPPPLSVADYAEAGIAGVTAENLIAVNAQVLKQPSGGANSAPEVQALVYAAMAAIQKIEAYNNGDGTTPPALTLADYVAAGITGVSVDNLAAVNAQVLKQVTGGANAVPEIQALVDKVATAVAYLSAFAQAHANGLAEVMGQVPGLTDFADAGVTGVNAANLNAIDDALASELIDGSKTQTPSAIQTLVDGYKAILATADGTANTPTPVLTGNQYAAVGVTGVSGASAPVAGTALYLLDNVVDGKAKTEVDTVLELQQLADAAGRVMTGVAGGTAPTLADFGYLGITGVNAINLATVQAAIDNATATGVDTLTELQAVVTAALATPSLTTTLDGVTNLDVTSNLVFSVDQSVQVGSGFIRITDVEASSMGSGYRDDTNTNDQLIDVATAISSGLLSIVGTGAATKIIINPLWDLDLSSNYQISIDAGAFRNLSGTTESVAIGPISFSTVAPGVHTPGGLVATEAVASQLMQNDGSLAASKSWMDIEGIGNNTGSITQLGDLAGGSYALVMKNYATTPGGSTASGGDSTDGIAAHDTFMGVVNFGNNDVLYFDSQVNNLSVQRFDANYTLVADGGPAGNLGGLVGQNALSIGLAPVPAQQGSQAIVALGLEFNNSGTIYGAVYDLPGTEGFANDWHALSPPVLMG